MALPSEKQREDNLLFYFYRILVPRHKLQEKQYNVFLWVHWPPPTVQRRAGLVNWSNYKIARRCECGCGWLSLRVSTVMNY